MTTQLAQDPWQTAMNPPEQANEWFGQIKVNPWFCSLVKGIGRVAWDPNQLDANGNALRRNTAIDLILTPISSTVMEDITRTVIAEFGEWPDVVLPSLKALGISDLQNLNGRWVRCEMAPTGRTYTNQNGETKNATTFKFLEVFADENAAKAAYKAARGGNGASAAPVQAAPAPAAAAPAGNGNGRRETALKFLKPYVENACRQANGDILKANETLTKMIASQPLLAEFFTIDSPEVTELVMNTLSPF